MRRALCWGLMLGWGVSCFVAPADGALGLEPEDAGPVDAGRSCSATNSPDYALAVYGTCHAIDGGQRTSVVPGSQVCPGGAAPLGALPDAGRDPRCSLGRDCDGGPPPAACFVGSDGVDFSLLCCPP